MAKNLKNQNGAGVQGDETAKREKDRTKTHSIPESVRAELQPECEEFIDLLNQIYWEGYAEALARENPAAFQMEYNAFFDAYGR